LKADISKKLRFFQYFGATEATPRCDRRLTSAKTSALLQSYNVIETHEHAGDFKELWLRRQSSLHEAAHW